MMHKEEFFASRGPVAAMAAWRASTAQRRRALSAVEAHSVIAELRAASSRNTLVALQDLVTGARPELSPHTPISVLFSMVSAAVAAGQLIVLAGWDFGDGLATRAHGGDEEEAAATPGPATLARRLMGGKGELAFEGRRYRLAASRASTDASTRQGYRQIGHVEARAVIQRMAATLATTPQARAQWAELVELMAAAPGAGTIRLLRYVSRGIAQASTSDGPATTPSQLLGQVAPQDWVEIEIAYDDGTPFDGECAVELPGGRIVSGVPDQDGVLRLDGLTPGNCKLRLPTVDASAVKPA